MGFFVLIFFFAAIFCATVLRQVDSKSCAQSLKLRHKGIRPLPTIIEETASELQLSLSERVI
jgi:hypothetical protein